MLARLAGHLSFFAAIRVFINSIIHEYECLICVILLQLICRRAVAQQEDRRDYSLRLTKDT